MTKRKPLVHRGVSSTSRDRCEWTETSQRVLLQARIVRDSARNLIADMETLETLVEELNRRSSKIEPISSPPTLNVDSRWRRVMRVGEVAQAVGLCRSTIYRMVQEGLFPKQLHLSDHAVGWRAEDVDAWLAACK